MCLEDLGSLASKNPNPLSGRFFQGELSRVPGKFISNKFTSVTVGTKKHLGKKQTDGRQRHVDDRFFLELYIVYDIQDILKLYVTLSSYFIIVGSSYLMCNYPKTNIAPENRPGREGKSFPNHHF